MFYGTWIVDEESISGSDLALAIMIREPDWLFGILELKVKSTVF